MICQQPDNALDDTKNENRKNQQNNNENIQKQKKILSKKKIKLGRIL